MAYPCAWGGKREGAGRKRRPGRRKVAHRKRERFAARYPLHVTLRMADDVPRLRRFRMMRVLAVAFVHGCRREKDGSDRTTFRICQFSIQGNHIHLLCEASNAYELGRGMQAFKVRVTNAINRHVSARGIERAGTVFADRYHVEVLRNPRQVRNALCYVLQNARRHGAHRYERPGWVDPYSSARYFDGWEDIDAVHAAMGPLAAGADPPVTPATTWLLTEGWQQWGLIGIDEVPAAGSA